MVTVIRDKILNFTGTDWAPIVLVGNKTDLQGQRQISRDEGEELASKWKCLSCETSAKTNMNIGKHDCSNRVNVYIYFYLCPCRFVRIGADPSPTVRIFPFLGRAFELMLAEMEKSTDAVPEDKKGECLIL